jgi:anti-sigma regulatory factor (Ser/Thr protein kinase)
MAEMNEIAELPSEAIWATTLSLPAAPASVANARNFAARFLTHRARLTRAHVDDVILVISELITNSIKYGGIGRPNIWLDVEIWSKWTAIIVDDRNPELGETSQENGELRESGRGLKIVEFLTERFWWNQKCISKTANAIILRPHIRLTSEDVAILDHLETAE